MPQELQLAFGHQVTFAEPFGDGGSIVFYSNTVNLVSHYCSPIDNTYVEMSSDDDILLRMSVRRVENAIVFNSRPSGGPWGQEERIPLQDVFELTDATITFRLQSSTWFILADAIVIASYNSLVQKPATRASYSGNDEHALVFSNPLRVTVAPPPHSYEQAYFPLTPEEVARGSRRRPFDYVIIGSGIGGGVLAADLHEKNKLLTRSRSHFRSQEYAGGVVEIPSDETKRILVIERGGLLFNTHSLNMPRPISLHYDLHEETDSWAGGAVYCLGGRSTVWGLFAPRICDSTFRRGFPEKVYNQLTDSDLQRAEKAMLLSFPQTHRLHRAVTDRLNIHDQSSGLPTTQWEWGRIASQFSDNRNFNFAEGAYSTVDRLLEAGMDDPYGMKSSNFRTLLNSPVDHLGPAPNPDVKNPTKVEYVVVTDSEGETHKIMCENVVIAAGAVDSPAIVLRSIKDQTPSDEPWGKRVSLAFGNEFGSNFGHLTDHPLLYVTLPFFYRNAETQAIVGGMKLQTDIALSENCTVLANISLDTSAFLPRRNVPDSQLPEFVIAFIVPSELNPKNSVELNSEDKPRIRIRHAYRDRDPRDRDPRDRDPQPDRQLDDAKRRVLLNFSIDVMNKIAAALGIQFVRQGRHIPLETVTEQDVYLGEAAPGGIAHEMGSLPMPGHGGAGGVLDSDLKMRSGWSNVYVCDLSVFPYSPAANPSLTLAALSLRLSDHLVPPESLHFQPIVIYNLSPWEVWVLMSTSRVGAQEVNPGPDASTRFRIGSGKSAVWKRSTRETIQIFAHENALSFKAQVVNPGINTLIVEAPPTD
ncbi:FAD/NAD(P)-binding domain-containing protein [Mycena sanguinolenta]|uniref:FAD/NAD(P)-binding domain-containing protein n=1 Tax=Mycena sanguinolenta TaxID=230812 RepID=A0A8H6YYX1_9AGAR|nr:FAD/NAD(P)-binding domain-containing protein [Mycena sanguinolenta]